MFLNVCSLLPFLSWRPIICFQGSLMMHAFCLSPQSSLACDCSFSARSFLDIFVVTVSLIGTISSIFYNFKKVFQLLFLEEEPASNLLPEEDTLLQGILFCCSSIICFFYSTNLEIIFSILTSLLQMAKKKPFSFADEPRLNQMKSMARKPRIDRSGLIEGLIWQWSDQMRGVHL